MTTIPSSLWPDDLITNVPTIPITVLKEQAAHLGRLTNNVVIAKVKGWTDMDGDFRLEFVLLAPALGNYEYSLFELYHGTELYPVRLMSDSEFLIDDEDELRLFLERTFSEDRTVRIVRALVAQARALPPRSDDDVPF